MTTIIIRKNIRKWIMKTNFLTLSIRTGLILSMTTAGLAIAQDAAPTDAGPDDIERIIVTGQKIARTLQETTTSVAVITSAQIEELNITNFKDTLDFTANAASKSWGGFSIRGIDGQNVSGGGNSYLASVYVDGVSIPRSLISAGGFSTWDAAQVEILRGPQSTLQGRNSLAGAVVMNTVTPTDEWQTKYRLSLGQKGQQEAALATGGGIIEDQLAFRFSAEKKDIDGFNQNTTRDETSDYREDALYRLKFLLTPSQLPDLSIQLGVMHATNTRGTPSIDTPDAGSPFEQRVLTNNDLKESFYTVDMVSLVAEYNINDRWDFTAATAYSDVDNGYDWDSDDTAQPIGQRVWDQTSTTFSQELRLTFDYDQFQGIVGAYYTEEKVAGNSVGIALYSLSDVGLTSGFLQASYGLDAATADLVIGQYAAFDPARTESSTSTFSKVTSFALFTDFAYQFNNQWELYGGLRWDHEKQENAGDTSIRITNADLMPDPASYLNTPYAAIAPLISGINILIGGIANNANGAEPLVDASFNTLLPKLGLSYHWSDDLTTSFTMQKGYRSGGVGTNIARAETYQYDAEYTNNYEFSIRSAWLESALTVNANFFFIDWKDQQVTVQLSQITFDSVTKNAGKSTVSGFELDVNYHINDEIKFYSSLGQAKSKFTDFIVEVPNGSDTTIYDLAGRSFSDSPQWTANIGVTYSDDDGFFADINANCANGAPEYVNPYTQGEPEKNPDGTPNFEFDPQSDGRTLINMQLGYQWENVGVYLIARNVFDRQYIESNGSEFMTLGQPRQVSLSLRGEF